MDYVVEDKTNMLLDDYVRQLDEEFTGEFNKVCLYEVWEMLKSNYSLMSKEVDIIVDYVERNVSKKVKYEMFRSSLNFIVVVDFIKFLKNKVTV